MTNNPGLTVTAGAYSLFRVLLGTFLLVHFVHLLPWSAEVFSNTGMLPDANTSPLFGILPNLLSLGDGSLSVQLLVGSAALASLGVLVGWQDRIAAVWVWYVLMCLFARNPLIANPSLPLVGWMVLAHAFIPTTPIGRVGTWQAFDPSGWRLPRAIFVSAWIVLALSYSYSGYTKLLSPSWIAGDNVAIVLENPLARDYFLREWVLFLPDWALKGLTWSVLWIELLFAPLALSRHLRPCLWITMLLVQFGFLFLLNFPDLTFPMLLIHLLTFDPNWVRPLHEGRKHKADLIFYDGNCALCHGVVRRVLAEDQLAAFRFAPLDSEVFEDQIDESARTKLPDSMIVLTPSGQLLVKGDAVCYILRRLGGIWGLIGLLSKLIPSTIRDSLYDQVGRRRLRWFGRTETSCPIVPSALRQRFVVSA